MGCGQEREDGRWVRQLKFLEEKKKRKRREKKKRRNRLKIKKTAEERRRGDEREKTAPTKFSVALSRKQLSKKL